MPEISTPLALLAERAMDAMVDSVARDGLSILKRLLDGAGFMDSQYLKDYDVLAHVSGRTVTYEVVVNMEAVEVTPEIQEEMDRARQDIADTVERTYGIGPSGPQRLSGVRDARRDARMPARDARRPARDARKNSRDRLIGHEVALHAPRSLDVTRKGKISISFTRTLREDDAGSVSFPRSRFEGVVGKFYDDLTSLILKRFAPAFEAELAGKFQ
jgi:hypothetical protein